MPFKTFTAGSALPASDGNTYLMQQQVCVFAGTAERSAAIGTPIHGQFSFLTSDDTLYYYDGSAWTEL
jgi:hypothetical protein